VLPIVLVLSEAPERDTRAGTVSSSADRVERVGKLRDGILVAGGGLYVLGYLAWSGHALAEGLGLLPALELQYLLAGSLLALFLLTALLLGVAAMRLAYASDAWAKSSHRSIRFLAPVTTFFLGVVVALLAVVLMVFAGVGLGSAGLVAVVFGGSLIAAAIVFTLLPGLKRFERPTVVLFEGGLIAVAATIFYLVIVYPEVPQELGGVRPRCGYVEVARADASGPLARELFASAQANDGIAPGSCRYFFRAERLTSFRPSASRAHTHMSCVRRS
jgi:hypothetical protein